MTTRTLYYDSPYLREVTATILDTQPKGSRVVVQLDQTIFYPEGGGQPSDQGEIAGPDGRLKVDFVQYKSGLILHQGVAIGSLGIGETTNLKLNWGHRYHNMRVHTAGHLLHDVLMSMTDSLVPLRGGHGKDAFLEYEGQLEPAAYEALEARVNEAAGEDMPVVMTEVSYEELERTCRFIPSGLPRNKTLRTLQIGSFSPMPDGGVHVATTKEIGRVLVQSMAEDSGRTRIKYRVAASQ